MKLIEYVIHRHGIDRTYRLEFESDGDDSYGLFVVAVYDRDTLKWKYYVDSAGKFCCNWY